MLGRSAANVGKYEVWIERDPTLRADSCLLTRLASVHPVMPYHSGHVCCGRNIADSVVCQTPPARPSAATGQLRQHWYVPTWFDCDPPGLPASFPHDRYQTNSLLTSLTSFLSTWRDLPCSMRPVMADPPSNTPGMLLASVSPRHRSAVIRG